MADPSAELRINLGASRTRLPEFVNVDIAPWADVSIDLSREALPFDDDSAEIVFSYHTLEHVENYLGVLREIHRVLQHGGWLLLGVPYFTLGEFNLVNPYHKNHFSEYSFDFFDPDKLLGSAGENPKIVFQKAYHEFHYLPEFEQRPEKARDWCRRHLFNVVQKIDFGLVAVKKDSEPVPIDADLRRRMKAEFERCVSSREPYPQARR